MWNMDSADSPSMNNTRPCGTILHDEFELKNLYFFFIIVFFPVTKYFYISDARQVLVYDNRCLGDNLPVHYYGYICVQPREGVGPSNPNDNAIPKHNPRNNNTS